MKLSVIIPVYNTEKYLAQCIESVLATSGFLKEIILVNDGSTDKSFDIIKAYEQKYSEIKVISQKNQGVSIARNTGIKACTGDYIFFLDSDDWVETKEFEKIVCDLKKDFEKDADIDIVVGKEKRYNEDTDEIIVDERVQIPNEFLGKIISGKEYLINSIKRKFWNVRLPIYLYKRKMLIDNNIYFPVRKCNEDEIFTINVIYYAKKIKIVNQILGYYRARSESLMSTQNINHSLDIFENAKELIEKYKDEKDKEIKKIIFYMIKKYYKSSMRKAIQYNRKDIFNKIFKQFKHDCTHYLFNIKSKKNENKALYGIYWTGSLSFVIEITIKKYRNKLKKLCKKG